MNPGEKYGIVAGVPANSASTLFMIGSLPIRTYSITMLLGMLAAILTISFFWKREKYKFEILYTLIVIVIPTAIVGARLWDLVEVALYDPNFNWSSWWKIWEGGLSIQGGVLLSAAAGCLYVYHKRHEIDFRKAIDIIIPTILIGQVIGRWGNYANHELYGKVDWDGSSVLIFGKSFAQNMFISDALSQKLNQPGLFRYPLFLYEGLINLAGYIILVWVINLFGLVKPGTNAGFYFIWYGVVRLALEPLRQHAYDIYTIAALVYIALGSILFIYHTYISPVHYIKVKQKYRYVYQMAHPQAYVNYINKTRLFDKNKKEYISLAY
ncbi:prolipoprotein diacylglyceryl transferase [Mycoplasmopsis californica HAZ160_1]|uniref:Phosphatidylglycerol--prolipoprotein diacylglyceryl transferase n=2 Tax=Mycoplasmopsis californica TaxID=2113 RepID=A0A059XRF2_9BACT|nr:prolipoprotein diacylglyceryl transferase [Mycoplasmopsis californica]AIA29363.1 prolipoprotein diacylglyceryl transferase [Mycoplasmopsis californica]BAP01183.1 prolipoprotein diacylglyceryl transferase [Mycoplasmopsis californica HAZ160_1]BBG42818.1 prolipoprotein diacylglyceryl transferase [Mycoplasmopsis californica]BBG43393.1 prolipoprotein diacylglyceryl transferase [Mycoplasmopsis californica]